MPFDLDELPSEHWDKLLTNQLTFIQECEDNPESSYHTSWAGKRIREADQKRLADITTCYREALAREGKEQ